MCEAPGTLKNGQKIACRKCKLCLKNRIKDWAGRNIAESLVSTASFACDLTYGPELDENRMPIPGRVDHIRAAVLTYSDVQNFLKYLRSHLGYEFAYFITGELGSLKGRAHWHIIFHFRGKVPSHELRVNFSDRHKNQYGKVYDHEVCAAWPHGFMYWDTAEYEDVFYNCKYITKDEKDDAAQRKPGMSKKPPLGARYFERVAENYVRQGISPQDLFYRLPGIKKKKTGEPVEFLLSGRSAEMYLAHFIKTWREQRGDRPWPKSDLVDLFEQYGKVVKDEQGMLERRDNPSGRAYQPAPTKDQIQQEKDFVHLKKLEKAHEWKDLRLSRWATKWMKGITDEQERQRREDIVNSLEERNWRRHVARLHDAGFVKHRGEWVKDAGGTRSCDCGHESCTKRVSEPESERLDTKVDSQRDYGPSRLDRRKTGYYAFISKPNQPAGKTGAD